MHIGNAGEHLRDSRAVPAGCHPPARRVSHLAGADVRGKTPPRQASRCAHRRRTRKSTVDWLSYLSGKGFRGRHATGAEVAFPCFFDCNEPSDSRKRKLYINTDEGLYSCKVCGAEGNGKQLMAAFGDEPEKEAPPTGRRSVALEAAVALGEKMLGNNDDALMYLLGQRRGLSEETIIDRRLGWADRHWQLSRNLPDHISGLDIEAAHLRHDNGGEVFNNHVLIPYIEHGRVVQLRGKDINGRYYTAPGDSVRLYNADSLENATEVVMVEGEFDSIILADLLATAEDQRLQRMAVVGLAGTNAMPDDLDHRLRNCRRIFLGTDPDDPGRKAANKLADRFGERAFIMQWPQALLDKAAGEGLELSDVDWTTWISRYGATWQQVGELLRAPTRLATMASAGDLYRARPTTGWKLGFAQLDAAIHPGLLPGQILVFLAKTGVGKTIILCNLAYNLRHRRILFITLEMTAEEIYPRLARIYRFYNPWASDHEVEYAYRDLRICDHNRLSEQDFARLIEEYTEDVGEPPDLVFVDYLGYYARGRKGGSTYEKTSDAVMQLKAEAKSHRVGLITPAQVNRGAAEGKPVDLDDARDSGVIEETADFMVGVWRTDDALQDNANLPPNGKLHAKILKSRHGGKDRMFLLQMGLMSLVLVDDGSPYAGTARRESHAVFRGLTYEQWLQQQQNRQPALSERT